MNTNLPFGAAFLVACQIVQVAAVDYVPPKGYVCRRADNLSIVIDGLLDEPAWDSAPWTDDFVDIEGHLKPKPRFRTRVKMLWDDTHFYIAAVLEEPHVWGTLKQRDSVVFHDNDFELFIDPDGDSHNYGEFEINALGTGWDLRLVKPYKDGGVADDGWELRGLKSAVHIDGTLNDASDTDGGWTIEMAIPWTALATLADRTAPINTARRTGSIVNNYERVPPEGTDEAFPKSTEFAAPPQDGDQWRINFSRVEWQHHVQDGQYQKVAGRREDNWVWSPQSVIDMHRPERWGYVRFTSETTNAGSFDVDAAGPAKHILHRIYYAQRSYQSEHNRYAASLEDLDLGSLDHETIVDGPTMVLTGQDRFQATVQVRVDEGKVERWHIRQDALVWSSSSRTDEIRP